MARQESFCEEFKEETYYYRSKFISDWPVVVFRAYPHPWELYVQTLDMKAPTPVEHPLENERDLEKLCF